MFDDVLVVGVVFYPLGVTIDFGGKFCLLLPKIANGN
jgi:hypothetical protein